MPGIRGIGNRYAIWLGHLNPPLDDQPIGPNSADGHTGGVGSAARTHKHKPSPLLGKNGHSVGVFAIVGD